MTETELTKAIADLAQGQGLLAHWCRDSRKCYGHKGFPDLVIAGKRGVIFAEIKTEDGETSAAQDLWIWTLSKTAYWPGHDEYGQWVEIHIWRSSDLEDGTIERKLEAIR